MPAISWRRLSNISTLFFGIYRDDGNVVFRGNRSSDEIKDWLFHFQELVNEEVGGNDIQFTMEICKPGEESRTIVPKRLKVVGAKTFPYLDMEMRFDESQNLASESTQSLATNRSI